jgi:tetrahydromethanopterin S-methyltransferase subunit E
MGYLQHHGFKVMIAGFCIVAACALVYSGAIVTHHFSLQLKNIIFSIAVGGLAIYFLGRILVHMEKKKEKQEAEEPFKKDKDPQ